MGDDESEQISQFDNVVDENTELLNDGCLSSSNSTAGSVEVNMSGRSCRRGTSAQLTNGRLTITQDGVYRREVWVPDDQTEGPTKFCKECRKITPRRCHHCPLCQICVLRKDHHCMLTGGCVGLANQVSFYSQTFFVKQRLKFSATLLFFSFGQQLARSMAQHSHFAT